MNRYRWQLGLGITLIILSAVVYYMHFVIFHDAHHIFIYLVGDIAFVFIEVLLVTLIIHSLLSMRDRRSRLEKLNMLIGTFFSEVGTRLIEFFSDCDPDLDQIKTNLVVTTDWSETDFTKVSTVLRTYDYNVDITKIDLGKLRTYLLNKGDFLLRLLENPNLLEHETFTELLRAVFHLAEELEQREKTKQLTPTDLKHLAGDIKRAYSQLVHEWLDYMHYLKNNYPYLFSLAMRLNPFDETASPEFK